MIKNIQEHHNSEEIEIIRLQHEIKQWKSELDFISHETEFYIVVFKSMLKKQTDKDKLDAKYISEQFFELKLANSTIRNKCENFHPKLEEMNECEDVQCDHVYLNAHLSLRSEIEKHISKFREIKFLAFTYLKKEIDRC